MAVVAQSPQATERDQNKSLRTCWEALWVYLFKAQSLVVSVEDEVMEPRSQFLTLQSRRMTIADLLSMIET